MVLHRGIKPPRCPRCEKMGEQRCRGFEGIAGSAERRIEIPADGEGIAVFVNREEIADKPVGFLQE